MKSTSCSRSSISSRGNSTRGSRALFEQVQVSTRALGHSIIHFIFLLYSPLYLIEGKGTYAKGHLLDKEKNRDREEKFESNSTSVYFNRRFFFFFVLVDCLD